MLFVKKKNLKINKKILPSYANFIEQLNPNTQTHTHTNTHTHTHICIYKYIYLLYIIIYIYMCVGVFVSEAAKSEAAALSFPSYSCSDHFLEFTKKYRC